jgi:thioredoxin-related protein
MILLNTQWCNSGRVIKNATFRDSLIVSITDRLFYPVYFDAESKDTVVFKGLTFVNDGKLGTFHSFAAALCNNRLVLPSIIFIDTNLDMISAIPQFYAPADMELILHYFGEDYYKTKTWEDFKKDFVPAKGRETEPEIKF